jgi:hypothetical protein
MQRMTAAMIHFRNNPEDPARTLNPSRRGRNGTAERESPRCSTSAYGSFQQKTRLASWGWRSQN